MVSLALYLLDTCTSRQRNLLHRWQHNCRPEAATAARMWAMLRTIADTITFINLFSGNLNETDSDNRLTYAQFDVPFADPRDMSSDYTFSPDAHE